MSINENTDTPQQNCPDGVLSFSELLDVLGFTDGEFVSICHKENDSPLRAAIRKASDGPAMVAVLPFEADIYFGINPIGRKIRGRGKSTDVTRLSALIADLDFSSGKCGDLATANAIIDDLSKVLGSPPSPESTDGIVAGSVS